MSRIDPQQPLRLIGRSGKPDEREVFRVGTSNRSPENDTKIVWVISTYSDTTWWKQPIGFRLDTGLPLDNSEEFTLENKPNEKYFPFAGDFTGAPNPTFATGYGSADEVRTRHPGATKALVVVRDGHFNNLDARVIDL